MVNTLRQTQFLARSAAILKMTAGRDVGSDTDYPLSTCSWMTIRITLQWRTPLSDDAPFVDNLELEYSVVDSVGVAVGKRLVGVVSTLFSKPMLEEHLKDIYDRQVYHQV